MKIILTLFVLWVSHGGWHRGQWFLATYSGHPERGCRLHKRNAADNDWIFVGEVYCRVVRP